MSLLHKNMIKDFCSCLLQPPVPVKLWSNIYDATEDGPLCPQPHGEILGPVSEDCLHLNVYTKNVSLIILYHLNIIQIIYTILYAY